MPLTDEQRTRLSTAFGQLLYPATVDELVQLDPPQAQQALVKLGLQPGDLQALLEYFSPPPPQPIDLSSEQRHRLEQSFDRLLQDRQVYDSFLTTWQNDDPAKALATIDLEMSDLRAFNAYIDQFNDLELEKALVRPWRRFPWYPKDPGI